MIKKFNFSYVYDLQNSSRTTFYRRYLFNISNWSSTKTTLKKGTKKSDFDQEPVLERFKYQLENSSIKTNYTLKPDFSWACINVDQIVNKFFGNKFILIFPFSSPQLSHKQWPYYNELIKIIKSKYRNLEIVIAPGQNEIEEAKKRDPLQMLKDLLYSSDTLDEEQEDLINKDARQIVNEATEEAENAPYPATNDFYKHVVGDNPA